MGTALTEGQNVHFDSGHEEFVLYARKNDRNADFVQQVCASLGCDVQVIMLACIPNWVGKSVTPSRILVPEEKAQELAEAYPNIIHFIPEEK